MSSLGIIGAGNVGCALAVDLSDQGNDVVLRTTTGHPGNTRNIQDNHGFLVATGQFKGCFSVKVSQGFTQLKETILFVAIPSTGIDEVLGELAGYDLRKTILIFITGHAASIKAHMRTNAKAVLETATSPYSSRISADGSISVRAIKKRLTLSVLGANISQDDATKVDVLFRMQVEWCPSVLQTFLSGVNGVVHVPTVLMNLGWMETTNGNFYFYRQGMSPGVCSVIEALDKERLAVAAAYNVRIQSVVETYNVNYGTNEATFRDFVDKTVAHNSTKGAQKRFLAQDVPYWLVLCSELGLLAGVPTKCIDTMIILASILTGTNYRATGNTLKSLGLERATVEEVIRAFRGGD
ncbi:6-phosphogluconate dehydrogenase [Cordyceps militaris]|uniref:6-phosphogluconate dehydrogenase n=1 Tax=Cordyceps militaris TaxID=73501 RepID=A0A2H4SFK8_CORMI|nr:6-phosphogluconate dehydrogenase [Cordyceps militaris]